MNVLLVRWRGGYHERVLPGSDLENLLPRRIECSLGLGAPESIAEVDRIADEQLRLFCRPREEIGGEIAPQRFPLDPTRIPWIGFRVGDAVPVGETIDDLSDERVLSATAAEDDQGYVSFEVTFKSLVNEGSDAFADWLSKMADGTNRGRSKPATPVAFVDTIGATCCPPQPPFEEG